ncbi:MAG: Asp-tRNA(Asn)/Glu-tRNA(Gln) amidotransferase subunit GatC [Polyangiaceae bacterium]
MGIEPRDVLHVARLARLELSDAEVARFQRELDAILGYMAELADVDTSAVASAPAGDSLSATLRPDERVPSLDTEQVVSQAPEHTDDCFSVPVFVDEG